MVIYNDECEMVYDCESTKTMEMNMNCYDKCWNCAWVVWWDCYDYENMIDIYMYILMCKRMCHCMNYVQLY